MATRKKPAPAAAHAHADGSSPSAAPCGDCAEKFRAQQAEQLNLKAGYVDALSDMAAAKRVHIEELELNADAMGLSLHVHKLSIDGRALEPEPEEDPDAESEQEMGKLVHKAIKAVRS